MLQKVISRLSFLYCLLLLLLFADCSLPDAPTVENQNRQSIGVDSLNDFVTAEMETGTKVLRGCTPSENTPSDTAGREKMNGKTYL